MRAMMRIGLGKALPRGWVGKEYCTTHARIQHLEQQLSELREYSHDEIELDQMSFDQLTKQRNPKYFSAGQKKMVDLVSLQHGAAPVSRLPLQASLSTAQPAAAPVADPAAPLTVTTDTVC